MACKKSFGSFWTSESHNLSHLFPFSLYYSSSHLQIMKAIMLLLRQTPFYDYEFLVRLGTKYSLHLCMQKRPHKIWANAFNKLSQDNAWKVPQTKILCTAKSGSAATKYAKKSGEIGVLLDIMSLSAVFFDVFTYKSNSSSIFNLVISSLHEIQWILCHTNCNFSKIGNGENCKSPFSFFMTMGLLLQYYLNYVFSHAFTSSTSVVTSYYTTMCNAVFFTQKQFLRLFCMAQFLLFLT